MIILITILRDGEMGLERTKVDEISRVIARVEGRRTRKVKTIDLYPRN